jgi:hypothetical protein
VSSADLDRVMVDQLRAVASEYRRQRDELGVALALALGALNRLSARAEKAEAEVERPNGAIDSHLQNLREIERGARELDAERMKSNACAEGLAAALRKIQNYTDETITCGWAREALEKFGGGE